MRRFTAVSALLIALVCGSLVPSLARPASYAALPNVLRMTWADRWIDTLEPQTNDDGISDLVLLNYEPLTRLDEELNVVPGAAESWQFSPDGLTLTFHLREGLTYSDGSPLTAERFRYAIARMCDPHLGFSDALGYFDVAGCEALYTSLQGTAGTPAPSAAAYERARANLGVTALDDRTLEVRLTQPAPYFPSLAGWIGFAPVKQELIEAGGPEWWRDPANWVGNGPFQLSAIQPDADPPSLLMTRNTRYWAGPAKLDGLDLVMIPGEERLAAYQRGELDVTYAEYDDIPRLEADPVLSNELLDIPMFYVDAFLFNQTRPPFTDPKVRQAFAYAFDREQYCQTIDYTCTPTLNWIPQGIAGHLETDAYTFDPVKARQALEESTYGGPENLPEVTWYYYRDDPWDTRRAEWLAAQYRSVLGVELTVTGMDGDALEAMSEDVATRPQITDTYWFSAFADPYEWLVYWTCGDQSFAQSIGYCNPAYDALVQQANRELDPATRKTLAEEAQRLLLADSPAIFAYTFGNIFLVKPSVTGYSATTPNQSFPGLATPLTVDMKQPTS